MSLPQINKTLHSTTQHTKKNLNQITIKLLPQEFEFDSSLGIIYF